MIAFMKNNRDVECYTNVPLRFWPIPIRTPFQGNFVRCGVPRPEGLTPQSDSTELGGVLRRGRSIGRIDYSPRARRSAAKAAWGNLCSPFGRLERAKE
jgi:hypothetical protein